MSVDYGTLWMQIVWQATLCLGIGIAASFLCRNRAVRADQVLWLAMLAAVLSPALSASARQLGWGLLAAPPAVSTTGTIDSSEADDASVMVGNDARFVESGIDSQATGTEAAAMNRDAAFGAVPVSSQRLNQGLSVHGLFGFTWHGTLLWGWCIAICIGLVRLGANAADAVLLIARSKKTSENRLVLSADAAATRLGINVKPDIHVTKEACSPMVWCWFGRPLLLVPSMALAGNEVDWQAVFCHELGHWKRRDHWSALGSQLLMCLLPWHPLAWWAKSRLAMFSEVACDEWALHVGVQPADYADSLLALTLPRRPSMALGAVSKRTLKIRIGRILSHTPVKPQSGRLWACVVSLVALSISAMVAVAQSRTVPIDNGKAVATDGNGHVKQSSLTVHGRVVGPDSQPIADATLYLKGTNIETRQKSQLTNVATTERNGEFHFGVTPTDYDDFSQIQLIAIADDFGPAWIGLADEKGQPKSRLNDLTLHVVSDGTPLQGRVLDLQGMPVKGATIRVKDVRSSPTSAGLTRFLESVENGMHIGKFPDFDRQWSANLPNQPAEIQTDSDGRFRVNGIGTDRLVHLTVGGPGIASGLVTTMTRESAPVRMPQTCAKCHESTLWDSVYGATFDLVAPPGRSIHGIVRDRTTGKPLSNVEVVGMQSETRSVTDESGRFELTGFVKESDRRHKLMLVPTRSQPYYIVSAKRPENSFVPFHAVRDTSGLAPIETEVECVRGFWKAVRVTDPDGKPLEGVVGTGLSHDNSWSRAPGALSTANYTLTGPPAYPRRVLFTHEEKQLIGCLIIHDDEPGLLEVQLQKWGVIEGRIIDGPKARLLDITSLPIPPTMRSGRLADSSYGVFPPDTVPTADGRFVFQRVVPGQKYTAGVADELGRILFENVVVQSGETKNLGDVRSFEHGYFEEENK